MITYLSQTATFGEFYSKINELIMEVNLQKTFQGELSGLTTLNKDNLVVAINEKSPSLVLSLILED